MKKILIVQPKFEPPAGGYVVACWMIEALKRDHALTVLTGGPFDLETVNRVYGTSLQHSDFRLKCAAPSSALFSGSTPTRTGFNIPTISFDSPRKSPPNTI